MTREELDAARARVSQDYVLPTRESLALLDEIDRLSARREEMLALLIEARTEIVVMGNVLRRELDGLDRRNIAGRIDKAIDEAQQEWLREGRT